MIESQNVNMKKDTLHQRIGDLLYRGGGGKFDYQLVHSLESLGIPEEQAQEALLELDKGGLIKVGKGLAPSDRYYMLLTDSFVSPEVKGRCPCPFCDNIATELRYKSVDSMRRDLVKGKDITERKRGGYAVKTVESTYKLGPFKFTVESDAYVPVSPEEYD